MASAEAKVLHAVAGLPMVCHVARAAEAAGAAKTAVVVGRSAEAVEAALRAHVGAVATHRQTERLGTAHAVLAARASLEEGFDDVLILFGDTPLVRQETLTRARASLLAGAHICVVGFRTRQPAGYGRLVERDGELVAIREERDASEAERLIDYCNGGVMALRGADALRLLDQVGNGNAKGEYYLTDIVEIARRDGLGVRAIEAAPDELVGVNTRVELAAAEAIWQERRRRELMLAGVTMIDPPSVHLAYDTAVGSDVLIEPNVVFGPGVSVASGAVIHAFCHIEGAAIAGGASVGPFARLRPGTSLAEGARVGNFCEVKNADIAAGAKVNHLSYIGDASVGAGANVGAGTITCNYDGAGKHRTEIGAGSFVGSNASLVAPVRVGAGAYVASGSTITEDVPDDALAIARGRQVMKPDRGRAIFERNARAKAERQTTPDASS